MPAKVLLSRGICQVDDGIRKVTEDFGTWVLAKEKGYRVT